MALAEVTYNAGLSCRIGKYTFPLNRGVLVRDADVIQRAKDTKGFSVHMIERKKMKTVEKKTTVRVEKTSSGKTKRALNKPKKAKKRDK